MKNHFAQNAADDLQQTHTPLLIVLILNHHLMITIHMYGILNNSINTNIHITKEQMENQIFYGYCLDSGASPTLVGIKEHNIYRSRHGKDIKLEKIMHSFKTVTNVHNSAGTFKARLPIPGNSFIYFTTHVAQIYCTILLTLKFGDPYIQYMQKLSPSAIPNKSSSKCITNSFTHLQEHFSMSLNELTQTRRTPHSENY